MDCKCLHELYLQAGEESEECFQGGLSDEREVNDLCYLFGVNRAAEQKRADIATFLSKRN